MLQTEPIPLKGETRAARDYIATMAGELADMARESGDRRLALVLDLAATFAEVRLMRDR